MFHKTDPSIFKMPNIPARYSRLNSVTRRMVREEYIKRQDGKCYYCGESLTDKPPYEIRTMKVTPKLYPKGFFNYPIHLHHHHNTDFTIGVVHAHCNAVLWEYENE